MQVSGAWLAALAIALHALWPLIASARPKAVDLVPVCTVEGVTHYVEVPRGKSPLDESSSAHHEHCSFCFLGERIALPSHFDFLRLPGAAPLPAPIAHEAAFTPFRFNSIAARAPPASPWVLKQPIKENHESVCAVGRHRDGAVVAEPRASVLRGGVLHR